MLIKGGGRSWRFNCNRFSGNFPAFKPEPELASLGDTGGAEHCGKDAKR